MEAFRCELNGVKLVAWVVASPRPKPSGRTAGRLMLSPDKSRRANNALDGFIPARNIGGSSSQNGKSPSLMRLATPRWGAGRQVRKAARSYLLGSSARLSRRRRKFWDAFGDFFHRRAQVLTRHVWTASAKRVAAFWQSSARSRRWRHKVFRRLRRSLPLDSRGRLRTERSSPL